MLNGTTSLLYHCVIGVTMENNYEHFCPVCHIQLAELEISIKDQNKYLFCYDCFAFYKLQYTKENKKRITTAYPEEVYSKICNKFR